MAPLLFMLKYFGPKALQTCTSSPCTIPACLHDRDRWAPRGDAAPLDPNQIPEEKQEEVAGRKVESAGVGISFSLSVFLSFLLLSLFPSFLLSVFLSLFLSFFL